MRRSVMAAGIGVAAIVGWRKVFTPWQRNWGATEEEVATALPGDALTPPPVDQCTRAITIAVPPEAVWPWLVQMGADRGGFYSYAWMENLFGLQIHNADRIHDEWQQLAEGDALWGDRRRRGGWVVERLEPNVALVLKTADPKTGRAATRDQRRRLRVPVDLCAAARPARRHETADPRADRLRPPADPLADDPRRARQLHDDPQDARRHPGAGRVGIDVTHRPEENREDEMATETNEAPKLPPAWFKHLFWRVHRFLYRVLGSRVLWTPASKRGWGAMHLTTVGRKSGDRRAVILGYIEDGSTPVVLAMNGWDEGQPAWWLNLEANPGAVIRLKGEEQRPVRARRGKATNVSGCGAGGPRSTRASTPTPPRGGRHARGRLRTRHRPGRLTPARNRDCQVDAAPDDC